MHSVLDTAAPRPSRRARRVPRRVVVRGRRRLDGRHAVFGKVREGMDVVETLGTVATGSMDRPIDPVVLEKVTVHRA